MIFRVDDNEISENMVGLVNKLSDNRKEELINFFEKLDKDRREKNCEYAVLVSLLEADSELYNVGIVDVSHRFPKMYVVRPQFFIQMITLLRNAALNAMEYKAELALVRAQNVDITNFESQLLDFQSDVAINAKRAKTNFDSAISEIDEAIKRLEKTKSALLKVNDNYRIANDKVQDLSIRKLTRGNPTMAQKFEELKSAD